MVSSGKQRSWRLPAPWVVALRYFRSRRRDASIRMLTSLTAAGIALGVASLVLAVAALSGFQSHTLDDVLSRTPTLQVSATGGVGAETRKLVESVVGTEAVQEILVGRGWLSNHGLLQSTEFVAYERSVPRWIPSATSSRGLQVSSSLMRRWNLSVGDRIEMISPRPQLSPVGPIPRNRFAEVRGEWDAGRTTDLLDRAVVPSAEIKGLLWESDRRLDIEIDDPEAVASRLRALLATSMRVETARDLQRSLYFALALEKVLMFTAVFLIVLVASQTLVSSVTLIVASKTREIGMLGAMGMAPTEIRRVFLVLGGLLAVGGVLVGGLIGCTIAWALDRFEVLRLPPSVYVVDYVPFSLRPLTDLPMILFATLALTLLAALTTGNRASKLQPVEALRR